MDWETLRKEMDKEILSGEHCVIPIGGMGVINAFLTSSEINKMLSQFEVLIRQHLEPPDRVEAVATIIEAGYKLHSIRAGGAVFTQCISNKGLARQICQIPVEVKLPVLSDEELRLKIEGSAPYTHLTEQGSIELARAIAQAQWAKDKEALQKAGIEVEE